MKHTALAFWASPVIWIAVLASPSWSQQLAYEDGYIHYVEGSVHLQRALEPEPEPGEINVPVLPGDRVWTEAGSRAEIHFSDGTILRLDERTKIDVIDLGTEQLFHVWSGSVIVVKPTTAVFRLDSPAGSVQTQTEGSYRMDVQGGETVTLSVYAGVAELGSDRGSVVVRRDQRSVVGLGQAPDSLWAFRTTDYDDFDRWSAGRSPRATSSRSAVLRSLPPEVEPYASELAAYGQWQTHSDYGSIWYPTVGVGWAPYRDGRWCYTPYGYTWVSYERWGWAPYHYGRWGYGSYGWYWIPGRHWGPAWVSFAVGPAWIGWSPLGYHGRPVYGFHSVIGHGYGGHRAGRPYRGGKAVPRELYEHGAGWNFVDRKHFARSRARSARLRLEDVERGSAQASLLEDGAVLNRDFTPRAVGVETGRHEAGARGLAMRRSTASIGKQARTALRTRAIQSDAQAPRSFASPSRVQRSTPVQRTRGSSSFASRSRARSGLSGPSVERSNSRFGGRDSDAGPSRSTVDDRARTAPPDSSRATGRPIRDRGGRALSGGAERARPSTPSRAPSTRGRSSNRRGEASVASPGPRPRSGVHSGNRTSSRAPVTRGSRATTSGGSGNNRGLGANPAGGRASRARKR